MQQPREAAGIPATVMRPGAPGWTRAWEPSHPKSRTERTTSERSRRNVEGGPNERCLAGSMGAINGHGPFIHHPLTHNPCIHNPFIHHSTHHPSKTLSFDTPKEKDVFGLCSSENQTMAGSICYLLKRDGGEMARLHSQIPGSQMKRSHASVGGHQSSSCIAAVAAYLRSGNMCSELAASLLHKTLQLSAGDFLMLTFQKLQKCSKRNKNKKKMPTDRPPTDRPPASAESAVHPLRNWFRIYSI